MRRAFTYTGGILAVFLYLLMVAILFLSLKSNKKDNAEIKPKEEKVIAIDMSKIEPLKEKEEDYKPSSNLVSLQAKKIDKPIEKEFKKVEPEVTPAKAPKETVPLAVNKEVEKPKALTSDGKIPKEIIKPKEPAESPATKPATPLQAKTETVKKQNLNDLFSGLKTKDIKLDDKPPRTKSNPDATKNSSEATINKNVGNDVATKTPNGAGQGIKKQEGVPDSYKNDIKRRLKAWPASDKYAGEVAKVNFIIKTSGSFEFTVSSRNNLFKQELIQYLTKLQTIGFDAHGGGRSWSIDTTFEAGE